MNNIQTQTRPLSNNAPHLQQKNCFLIYPDLGKNIFGEANKTKTKYHHTPAIYTWNYWLSNAAKKKSQHDKLVKKIRKKNNLLNPSLDSAPSYNAVFQQKFLDLSHSVAAYVQSAYFLAQAAYSSISVYLPVTPTFSFYAAATNVPSNQHCSARGDCQNAERSNAPKPQTLQSITDLRANLPQIMTMYLSPGLKESDSIDGCIVFLGDVHNDRELLNAYSQILQAIDPKKVKVLFEADKNLSITNSSLAEECYQLLGKVNNNCIAIDLPIPQQLALPLQKNLLEQIDILKNAIKTLDPKVTFDFQLKPGDSIRKAYLFKNDLIDMLNRCSGNLSDEMEQIRTRALRRMSQLSYEFEEISHLNLRQRDEHFIAQIRSHYQSDITLCVFIGDKHTQMAKKIFFDDPNYKTISIHAKIFDCRSRRLNAHKFCS